MAALAASLFSLVTFSATPSRADDTAAAKGARPESMRPSDAAPPHPPPLISAGVSVHSEAADVAFEGGTPGTEFYLKTGQGSVWAGRGMQTINTYQAICVAPCKATLPVGTHDIGLSHGTDAVALSDQPVAITGSGTLLGTHVSRAKIRTLAGVVGGGALVTGGALLAVGSMGLFGFSQQCMNDPPLPPICSRGLNPPNIPVMALGATLAAAGLVAGLALFSQADTSIVTFIPGTPALSTGGPKDRSANAAAYDPRGASVAIRF